MRCVPYINTEYLFIFYTFLIIYVVSVLFHSVLSHRQCPCLWMFCDTCGKNNFVPFVSFSLDFNRSCPRNTEYWTEKYTMLKIVKKKKKSIFIIILILAEFVDFLLFQVTFFVLLLEGRRLKAVF